MPVKKQIPGLCKLYPFYEEIPKEFLDETDVDSYFYHNIFELSLSQHRIVRVSGGSNKKSFAIKLFQFCDLKTQQRYILQEEVNISKRELTCLVDSLRDFLKTFGQAIIEHPNRQIRLCFRFGNNNSSIFSLKSLNYTAIILFLQKLSTLTFVKFTISTRTDVTLQTSVK